MNRNTLEDLSVGQSPIDKYNEEVRGWTYSSKNPERPPDTKKMNEENHLEKSKIKRE